MRKVKMWRQLFHDNATFIFILLEWNRTKGQHKFNKENYVLFPVFPERGSGWAVNGLQHITSTACGCCVLVAHSCLRHQKSLFVAEMVDCWPVDLCSALAGDTFWTFYFYWTPFLFILLCSNQRWDNTSTSQMIQLQRGLTEMCGPKGDNKGSTKIN